MIHLYISNFDDSHESIQSDYFTLEKVALS